MIEELFKKQGCCRCSAERACDMFLGAVRCDVTMQVVRCGAVRSDVKTQTVRCGALFVELVACLQEAVVFSGIVFS